MTERGGHLVVIVFALAAALLYGSADFFGGVVSRRVRALSVLTVSVPAGAVIVSAAALVMGGPVRSAGLGWAVAAGAAGSVGMIVCYAGLAVGPMSVVSPVSALMSTVLPVGVAVATGERPGLAVAAGAVLCLVAIGLVSLEGGPRWPRRVEGTALRGVGYGIASGVAFGTFFLLLRYAGESGLLWPVSASKAAGSVVVLGAAWFGVRARRGPIDLRVLPAATAVGMLDAGANVCYLLATRAGMFGMAVVLTSLYPGITVLLARVMLGERMCALQRFSLVLAAVGVILVVV